jgi:hypothetical protein
VLLAVDGLPGTDTRNTVGFSSASLPLAGPSMDTVSLSHRTGLGMSPPQGSLCSLPAPAKDDEYMLPRLEQCRMSRHVDGERWLTQVSDILGSSTKGSF